MADDLRVVRLEEFKKLLRSWNSGSASVAAALNRADLRTRINQEKAWVRREVIEAGCLQTLTVAPPAAVGGLVMRNLDPFDVIFSPPYGMDVIPTIVDMIDHAIGVLRLPTAAQLPATGPTVTVELLKDYAFVAMPMDRDDPGLVDVLDAIREAAARCGIRAERIDEPASNERITDRILQSIRAAEFVIVDLTKSKPNVYYEAGYAHGIGKLPVFIARNGTRLEFDLKDYPVIFFSSLKELKDELERRLRGVAARSRP